jgi:hypothetical protein
VRRSFRSQPRCGATQWAPPLFIVMSPDNRADDNQNYSFTQQQPLITVNFPRGNARLFSGYHVSVGRSGEFRRPFFTPTRSIVSSAHRRLRTALTDEGLLLGKLVFGSLTLVRPR